MDHFQSQQEPTLGFLDNFLDAAIERGTQAMMESLDGRV